MENKILVLLLIILFVGAFLRLNYVEYGRFTKENARDNLIAQKILDGNIRLEGVTATQDPESKQQSFGPLYYYFIALGLWLFNSPLGPAYIVAILNVISLLLCFLYVKEFFGDKAALISTSLYAVAPWHIAHTSIIMTTPNFLPPFVILLIHSLSKVIIKKEDKYLILSFISLAILSQFHLSVLWLFILTAVLLLIYRRDLIKSKYFIISFLIAFLFYIPFLIFNTTQGSLKDVFIFIGNRYTNPIQTVIIESLGIPVMLTTNYFGKYLLGDSNIYSSLIIENLSLLLTIIISLIVIVSILFLIKQYFDTKEKKYSILLLWILIPILGYISKSVNVSPHYMHILYPSLFIVMGISISKLLEKYKKATSCLLIIILLGNIIFITGFFNYIDTNGNTKGLYHESYANKIKTIDYIKSKEVDNLIFYKSKNGKIEYTYLSKLNHTSIDSIYDLKKSKGFLILNRFDYRSHIPETNIPKEELDYLFNNFNVTKIGGTEVIEVS